MTTVPDYKAMVTTEIRVPLAQITSEDVVKIIGKNGRNLKIIEDRSNTRCAWDKKNLSIYIHGEPKAAKQAYTTIMAQMSKVASANGTTAPDAMVNILGKEYVDGVQFCKLTDAMVVSDDEDVEDGDDVHIKRNKVKPAIFVVHPVTMTDKEKQKGRVMASDLWRNAQFVTWNFKENVIQDASMVLRRQLQQLPEGEGKYLKLEMSVGKVIFHENDRRHFPLQGAKFAIAEFRHLRFNKEITSEFRTAWEESWITKLRCMLPTLGYDKDGITTKTVKIYHTAQRSDGKCYEVVWSTEILEGKRLGDAKAGTLEFTKSRVRGNNPFSATVYGSATAFDLRFSIITNTRESAAHNREIEDRIGRAYRYSAKRGLLVNHTYENSNGYTPLVNPKARLVYETTWVCGDIKVIISEIQDGPDSTFEVKIQSNLLKKYTHEEPGVVPLSDIVDAVKDFLEAAEEINGELNLLTAELPKEVPNPATVAKLDMGDLYSTSPSAMQPSYEMLGASIHNPYGTPKSNKVPVSKMQTGKSVSQISPFGDKSGDDTQRELLYSSGSSLKKTNLGAQQKKGLVSPMLPDPPTVCSIKAEVFWEGRVVGTINEFGPRNPVLLHTNKTSQESSFTAKGVLPKHKEVNDKHTYEQKPIPTSTDTPPRSNSSETVKKGGRNIDHGKSVTNPGPGDPLLPHLRPVIKSPKPGYSTTINFSNNPSPCSSPPTRQPTPSYNNFSDRFFDLLGSTADGGSSPSTGVLTPKKIISPRSGKLKIDFFGSVGSLRGGDAEDLLSWSPDNDAFTYVHDNDSLDTELGEGVSLLLD